MQGMLKTSSLLIVVIPLLAACTSQSSIEVGDRFQQVKEVKLSSTQRSRVEIPTVDNCAAGAHLAVTRSQSFATPTH